MNSTQNLKHDHIAIRRIKNITQTCSNNLYANKHVPIEDIEVITVIIEEFIDHFHHGKEENAYFPDTKDDSNPSGGNAYSSSFLKCGCKISSTSFAASPIFPPILVPL